MPFGRKRTGGYGARKRMRLENLQLAREKKKSGDESVATATASGAIVRDVVPMRLAQAKARDVSSYAPGGF